MDSTTDPLEQESEDIAEKDIPLREDIRELGRLLGDTVRAQEGQLIFDLIEKIRHRRNFKAVLNSEHQNTVSYRSNYCLYLIYL